MQNGEMSKKLSEYCADAILLLQRGWCQGGLARDVNNFVVRPDSVEAIARCPGGAVMRACEEDTKVILPRLNHEVIDKIAGMIYQIVNNDMP